MLKNTLSIQNQPKSLSLNALIRDGTKIASQSVSLTTLKKSFLSLSLTLTIITLFGCGGGGGGGGEGQGQNLSSNEDDVIFTGGDGFSPDDNLVIATFSDTASLKLTGSAVKSARVIDDSSSLNNSLQVSALSKSRSEARWISQHTSSCSDNGGNGYCGFASVLMGVDYLLNGNTTPPSPATVGYDGETAKWIYDSVKSAFESSSYSGYLNCGGSGILPFHISFFSKAFWVDEVEK